MIKSRWFFHPLVIFIFSLVALLLSLAIYIRSYLEVSSVLQSVIYKYHLDADKVFKTETWILILSVSILVALILIGFFIIYIYYQKVIQLYRLQQNFINGFTHELKTPIASLRLLTETLARHKLSREEELNCLSYMQKDTKRLSDNVDRILQLGRLEGQNVKVDFKLENIVELIDEFVKQTPHLFEDGRVEFQSEVKEFHLMTEKNLFEMLLMNLITNAFIYNKSQVKSVVIKLYLQGSRMLLEVADNGIGIEKNQLKKIFKKFYQVGKTTRGSGLGLYIAQSIARFHDGEIWAESPGLGKGTTMKISFKI